MKRKVIVVLCVILMAVLLSVNAFADSDLNTPGQEDSILRWDNTCMIWAATGFEDDLGYTDASIDAYFDITHTTIDAYVYKKSGNSWTYLTEKHVSANDCSLCIEVEFDAVYGSEYKTELVFTATKNGNTETIYRTVYKTYTE